MDRYDPIYWQNINKIIVSLIPVFEVRGNTTAAVPVGATWTLILNQFFVEHGTSETHSW